MQPSQRPGPGLRRRLDRRRRHVIQWTANGSTSQQWRITRDGAYFTVTNRKSGKVLAVTGALTQNGADIVQRTADGGAAQQWSLS